MAIARFSSRDDMARFVPNVTTVVVPLVQVASCEQQSPDNIRMAVAHGKVCWSRKARVLYIDLDPSFQERFDHIQVPLCSAKQAINLSFRATCLCTSNGSRNDGKQGQRLLSVVITSCAAKCKGVRSLLLLLLALACLPNIFLTAVRLPTIAAPAPPSTPIARVKKFRDEQCACT
jgi:hypothetical protein